MSVCGEIEYCEEQIEQLREDLDELYLLKMHKLATLLSLKKRLAKLKGIHK
jgi:hypothetical protein